jgi:hypothetical protein
MLSYSGRFKGKTAEVSRSAKKVEFPEAPTMASVGDYEEQPAQEGA